MSKDELIIRVSTRYLYFKKLIFIVHDDLPDKQGHLTDPEC